MFGTPKRRLPGLIFDFCAYCTAVCASDFYSFLWKWLHPVDLNLPKTPANRDE